MGILEDILKALDRVPGWKRINGLPSEFDELKKRVEALEATLSGGAVDACPMCNKPSFKRIKSAPHRIFGDMGLRSDTYQCSECQYQEERERNVLGK